MAWMIVSDSSCEIRELENPAPGVQFALVPFKIRVGEREYVDASYREVHIPNKTGISRCGRYPLSPSNHLESP